MIWRSILGAVLALLLAWGVLVLALLRARPPAGVLQEALRLLPDTIRLLRRLSRDAALPRSIHLSVWLLIVYLALPIDVIPDFIPIIGYADDAILICVVLRFIVRRAGPEAVVRNWPGTTAGLAAIWRAAALPGSPPDSLPGSLTGSPPPASPPLAS